MQDQMVYLGHLTAYVDFVKWPLDELSEFQAMQGRKTECCRIGPVGKDDVELMHSLETLDKGGNLYIVLVALNFWV